MPPLMPVIDVGYLAADAAALASDAARAAAFFDASLPSGGEQRFSILQTSLITDAICTESSQTAADMIATTHIGRYLSEGLGPVHDLNLLAVLTRSASPVYVLFRRRLVVPGLVPELTLLVAEVEAYG